MGEKKRRGRKIRACWGPLICCTKRKGFRTKTHESGVRRDRQPLYPEREKA